MLRPVIRALPLLALLFSLAACIPETGTWLSDVNTAKPDPRLYGSFVGGRSDRERHLIVVTPVKDKDGKPTALMDLVWVQVKPDNDEKTVVWAAYRAWPARLPNGVTLLNMRRVAHGPTMERIAPQRFFVRYTVNGDGSVTTRMPRNRPWSQAVQTGAVAGRVVKGRYFDQVTLAGPRAKLRAYVAAHADALFEPDGVTWRPVKK